MSDHLIILIILIDLSFRQILVLQAVEGSSNSSIINPPLPTTALAYDSFNQRDGPIALLKRDVSLKEEDSARVGTSYSGYNKELELRGCVAIVAKVDM